MSQPDPTRQRAEQSCCAHMTVYYRTHTDQGTSLTTGWWECSTCLTRFVPIFKLENATQAERARCAGIANSYCLKFKEPCGECSAERIATEIQKETP